MKNQKMNAFINNPGEVNHLLCPGNDTFPNNGYLELCIMRQVISPDNFDLAEMFEHCFQKNGWPGAWRNGLYDIHHYHSTAHEALGVYSGWVRACFGGPGGRVYTVAAGDVIIIPAGVSHKNLEQSADFKVVGAYPKGQRPNMKYGRPEERPQVDGDIQQVGLPVTDPVYGTEGPLMDIWLK